MKKIPLGSLAGTLLGLLDGLSAFFIPEAAAMMTVLSALPSGAYVEIIVPGTVVGLLSGFIAAKWGKR